MESGKARNKITIQTNTIARDAMNEEVETWVNGNTWWASIKPLSGKEGEQGSEITQQTTYELRGRYDSTITPSVRLIFGSRTFNVSQVLNVQERNRELIVLATEML